MVQCILTQSDAAHLQVMSRELRPEVDEVTFAAAAVPRG